MNLWEDKMLKKSNTYLILFLIFVFSFAYRMLLMHWATYPPGADIGLHESVINSITVSGNTNFLWNNYHMGGGLSLTFPGYHIFVSHMILITGLPDYLVHSIVVSFFSSFIVLCSFLITRSVWRESAGLVVAFLVAISRFDIEMLLWGGYPNVITLMLIPLIFYLFLQKNRISLVPFITTTAILSGALFLTHSLSAVMFVSITFATVIIGAIFSKRVGVSKTNLLIWFLPLLIGVILVSPFLVEAAPAYLGANSETFTGGVLDIRLALLSTRMVPLEWVIPLFACVTLFFLFAKKYKGKYCPVPVLLLVLWVLIPMVFTQGFLVGLYTDYNRFLYFIILPITILIGLGIDHGAGFFARIINKYLSLTEEIPLETTNSTKIRPKLLPHINRKNIYSGFILGFLLFSFLAVPMFLTPFKGTAIQSFYQTMTDSGYEAIQWARQNTAVDSVFVSDAYYGWWFSGFAMRPTLSAVDPQYLSLFREFEPAKIAKNLLDTDYIIDNGLIQVREDGGYIGRHNPMLLAKLNWTYFPYPFLNFNNSETEIKYRVGNFLQSTYLSQLQVKEMRMENDVEHASISVRKGNEFFNYSQLTTVYKGLRFAKMEIMLDSEVNGIYLDWLDFSVHSNGKVIKIVQNKTVGLLDEGVKAFGQLIFDKEQPNVDITNLENPCIFEIEYNLQGRSKIAITISLSAYSVTDNPKIYQDQETKDLFFNKIISDNLNLPQEFSSLPIEEIFDYQSALKTNAISYIANRDAEVNPKFANDPAFSLVFINDEVAIFTVRSRRSQYGS